MLSAFQWASCDFHGGVSLIFILFDTIATAFIYSLLISTFHPSYPPPWFLLGIGSRSPIFLLSRGIVFFIDEISFTQKNSHPDLHYIPCFIFKIVYLFHSLLNILFKHPFSKLPFKTWKQIWTAVYIKNYIPRIESSPSIHTTIPKIAKTLTTSCVFFPCRIIMFHTFFMSLSILQVNVSSLVTFRLSGFSEQRAEGLYHIIM